MAKQLLYTDDARKKLLAGADKLAHAVGITLGPTGRNVILDKSFGGPTVTKDGVTVSKEIDLADPFENMGAKLVNAVAQKTSDVAGDGTTTATILALSIYQEGLRAVTSGANPMAVKRGVDRAVEAAVKSLGGMTKKLSKKEETVQRPRHATAAGEGGPGRQAAPDHRRGRGERGPGGSGRQPPARRAAGLRRQGAGLRRPPQGHARRHCRAHRRPVHQRGSRH